MRAPGRSAPGGTNIVCVPGTRIGSVQVASFAELDAATLYALLRLRVDVFVVEQRCPYPELDGRDTEPDTRHLWLTRDEPGTSHLGGHGGQPDGPPDGRPTGYLRLLAEPGGAARIGRVAVAPHARGTGVAGRLLVAALAMTGDRECVLDAQNHLVNFYGRFGFSPAGPEYLEDGIPHVPMRRST